RAIGGLEIARVAGHLPGRLTAARDVLLAERVAQAEHVDRVGVDLFGPGVEQRLKILFVAGPAVRGPHQEPRRASATAAESSTLRAGFLVGLEVDGRVNGVASAWILLAMREQAIGHLQHHLLRLGRAVVEDEGKRRLKYKIAARLRPAPHAVPGHLLAVEVGRADVAMAGSVDPGEPLEAPGRDHGAL